MLDSGRIVDSGTFAEFQQIEGPIAEIMAEMKSNVANRQDIVDHVDHEVYKEHSGTIDRINEELTSLTWIGKALTAYLNAAGKTVSIKCLFLVVILVGFYRVAVPLYLAEWLNFVADNGVSKMLIFAFGLIAVELVSRTAVSGVSLQVTCERGFTLIINLQSIFYEDLAVRQSASRNLYDAEVSGLMQ